jgi:hypothetical protein
MPKHECFRRGCSGRRSQFLFMRRRRPPRFEAQVFCSQKCLQAHIKDELVQRWRGLQRDKQRGIPRPKLGAILMETAMVTRDQLQEALRLQTEAGRGRIGEWLLRIGAVEERQITMALARQFGLPVIDLKNSEERSAAAAMIPPPVAKCSCVLPVGSYGESDSLRVAVSGPVNFNLQSALGRMTGKRISTYIGDYSAIQALLERWYGSEETALRDAPVFSTIGELLDLVSSTVRQACEARAGNIVAELFAEYCWIRVDLASGARHMVFRYAAAESTHKPVPGQAYPFAAEAAC